MSSRVLHEDFTLTDSRADIVPFSVLIHIIVQKNE